MKLCKNCSTENSDDSGYCRKCGQPLGDETGAEVPESQPQKAHRNRWVIVSLVVLLVVAVICVGAFALLAGKRSSLLAALQPLPTQTDTPLPPTDTPLPTGTSTPTRVPPTKTPTVTPTFLDQQSWRVPQYPGSVIWADDAYTNSDVADFVAEIAHVNAVKEPYYWDLYGLPNDTRFADIENYFKPLETGKGMMVGNDDQWMTVGGHDTFLLSFFSSYDANATYIYMEFWPHATGYDAQLLIFYVNP